MGTIPADEQPDLEKTVEPAHARPVPPPEYLCEGLEELAERHADAKQAFLEQTGHFEDLRALLKDRPNPPNNNETN